MEKPIESTGYLEKRLREAGKRKLQREIEAILKPIVDKFGTYGNVLSARHNLINCVLEHYSVQYQEKEIKDFVEKVNRLDQEVEEIKNQLT